MSHFTELVNSRRSAMKFIPEVRIETQELEDIFQIVKSAPSAFNLQHARYLVVRDPAAINRIYEASGKQYKIKTASAVLVVLGNMEAYREVGNINEGLLNLGVINKQEYDQTVSSVQEFYESRGETFQREEAIRNASLSAMLFMLSAKDKGWDTCPMIGFDPELLASSLQIPEQFVPAMLVAIGKEDTSSQRPRGYRKPVGEFVSFDSM